MTAGGRRRALVALAAVASVAGALLAHAAMVRGVPVGVGAAISLVPIALVLAARRAAHPVATTALFALLALAAWLAWPRLEEHFPDLLFVEHATLNVGLGILFGRTLLPGQEPLVTRFARITHGGLPPGVGPYSRKVTIAWTVFFFTMLAISCALYVAGLSSAWSFFATMLNPILVGAMFMAEYGVRHRVLPDLERIGLLGGVRAFMRHFQAARAEAPR